VTVRRFVVLLGLAGLVFAQEAARPLVFFRQPDKKTGRTIEKELISGNGIGSGASDRRAESRRLLEVYDAWAVPYLAAALHGRDKDGSHMVRVNAALTLARILDPRALPELREAAVSDSDRWVRRASLLSLGLFAETRDVDLFIGVLDHRKENRREPAAALALGKLRGSSTAANALLSRLEKPPDDDHLTCALLLAAALRSPQARVEDFLAHDDRLVQRVAAACLQLRPLEPGRIGPLLRQIERGRYREVRELQFYALATMAERTNQIREVLVDCAVKTEYKTGSRVAALIGLAYEWGRKDHFEDLHRLERRLQTRNDPVREANLLALARTGDPRAVDVLLKLAERASPQIRFYAVGSLLHMLAFGPEENDRTTEIVERVLRARTDDADLGRLIDVFAEWHRPREGTGDRRKLVRDRLEEIGDPRGMHLFSWTREDRVWEIVNSMVPLILQLDFGKADTDSLGPGRDYKREGRGKEEGATEEELDLLSFLAEKPYFVPGDRE